MKPHSTSNPWPAQLPPSAADLKQAAVHLPATPVTTLSSGNRPGTPRGGPSASREPLRKLHRKPRLPNGAPMAPLQAPLAQPLMQAAAAGPGFRSIRLAHEVPGAHPSEPNGADQPPQMQLNQWAMRHVYGLSQSTKATVFGMWSVGATGQISQAATTVTETGVAGLPFVVLTIASSLYEVYSTRSDARHARQDYLAAQTMLVEQERLCAELEQAADPVLAPRLELVRTNILLLNAFTTSFEKAYYRDTQRTHAARARADIRKQARELSRRQSELRQLEDETDRLIKVRDDPATPAQQVSALHRAVNKLDVRRGQLQAVIDAVYEEALNGLSLSSLRQQARDHLHEAQQALRALQDQIPPTRNLDDPDADKYDALDREAEQLRHEIKELEKDLDELNRPLKKWLFDPLASLGPNEVKHIRSTRLLLPKAVVDTAGFTNTLLTIVGVADAALGTLTCGLTSAALSIGISRLDVEDARNEGASSSTAKLTALSQATRSAQLVKACQDSNDSEVRSHQHIAWSHLRCMGRTMREKHRAGNQAKSRGAKGTGLGIGATVAVGLGTASLATAMPYVAIPGATMIAIVGAGYYGTVAARNVQGHIAKASLKARAAVADTFIRLYGPQGIAAFARDMTSGNGQAWDERLQTMTALLAQYNPDLPAEYVQPAALLENEFLSIERMTRELHLRARDPGHGAHDTMATLAKELAKAASKPDPAGLVMAPGETLAQHQARVRMAVCELFGVKDYADDRLPLAADVQHPHDLVMGVNDALDDLPLDRPMFATRIGQWTAALAAHPDDFEQMLIDLGSEGRKRLQEDLSAMRETLGQRLIGPHELRVVQQQLVAGTRPVNGPLSKPGAAHLLELLADPSWLEPRDAGQPAPTPLVVPSAVPAVTALIKAMKGVGREQVVGPARNPRQPGTDPTARLPQPRAAHRQAMRSISKGLGKVSRSVGNFLDDQAHALGKHFVQKMPNPLATPELAVEQLEKASGEKRVELATDILRALMLEVYGIEMPVQPAVMSTLGPQADDLQMKVAHGVALLEEALQAAATASAVLNAGVSADAQSDEDARTSRSRARLQRRFDSTVFLCRSLIAYLQEGLDIYLAEIDRFRSDAPVNQDPQRLLHAFDVVRLVTPT